MLKKNLKIGGILLGVLILIIATSIYSPDGQYEREKVGSGFTDEEVISMIQETYGENTAFVSKSDTGYIFQAQVAQPEEGSFSFCVEQGENTLLDNYLDAYFKYIGDCFFQKYYMQVEWMEDGMGASQKYTPLLKVFSGYEGERMAFCERICDFVEYAAAVEPFGEEARFFKAFHMVVAGRHVTFQPSMSIEDYERTTFYNELYVEMDEVLHGNETADSQSAASQEYEEEELDQEVIDYYLSADPACSYVMDNGTEFRMIPVDRALGSSYYVLIGTRDQGKTCSFVNRDPYNGSGGEARWITFVDEVLGFSCLAHSGGSYGSLYRTEDGGVSWDEMNYPSAKAKLSNGTYYNPFLMPEKVYEKNGVLYMEAGQGADGDYYDTEKGFCHGLYQSFDKGLNWEFVENIPAER